MLFFSTNHGWISWVVSYTIYYFHFFRIMKFRDSFPWLLVRFKGPVVMLTIFSYLLVCVSSKNWSGINMRLFHLTASKLNSLTHTLPASQISSHFWTIRFQSASFQQADYLWLLIFVPPSPLPFVFRSTQLCLKKLIVRTILPIRYEPSCRCSPLGNSLENTLSSLLLLFCSIYCLPLLLLCTLPLPQYHHCSFQ